MQRRSCAERHPILASVGVPVLAAILAYWWSAAAVVVIAAAVCMCVMLHGWWRFEVAAQCKEAARARRSRARAGQTRRILRAQRL